MIYYEQLIDKQLTVDILKDMSPCVFRKGEINNADLPEPMVNIYEYPGLRLKWVAKRGQGYHDWAVYLHFDDQSFADCVIHGQKTRSEKNIRLLVPCTDEAFAMYRK